MVAILIIVGEVGPIITSEVTGQSGDIGGWIALGEIGLSATESTVESDAVFQLEGGAAVVVGLIIAFVGIVGALGDPDFVSWVGGGKGVLEVVEGIGP